MVIAIVILLLFIASALLGAMYSNFTAFLVNFTDIHQYNKAYYSAVSGLERAELVLRYRSPGYEGSGGRLGSIPYGVLSPGDRRPSSDFSFLSSDERGGIFWEIHSRTKTIPAPGQGNIDWMLASGNRLDFNRLDYADAENFTFMLDSGNNNPYALGTIVKNTITSFTGKVQLPYILKAGTYNSFSKTCSPGGVYCFGPLDATNARTLGGGVYNDDPIVDRSFRKEGADGRSLQVMSTWNTGDYFQDSRLLESRINAAQIMEFGAASSPFVLDSWGTLKSRDARLTGIVEKSEDLWIFNGSFTDFLSSNTLTGILFRLSLINPLYSESIPGSSSGYIFPYLEYQFSFPNLIADRYYSITTKGKNGSYEVQLFTQKPTIVESILRTFTVIF